MQFPNLALGADIGGTHISSGLVHCHDGQVVPGSLQRIECPHHHPAEQILDLWARAIAGSLAYAEAAGVRGLGLAVPGPFDYLNGISHMQHKFAALNGIPIAAALHTRLPGPWDALPIRFINDATAFAMGEAWQGSGRGANRAVVVTLGTGFGSAFLEAGIPVVRGAGVPPEGCLWHLPFLDRTADYYCSAQFFAGVEGATADVAALAAKADREAAAQQQFEQYGAHLGQCLAPWLKAFDAEVLILGGSIAGAMRHFGPAMSRLFAREGVRTRVITARRSDESALIGASRLLDDTVWARVSSDMPRI